MDDHYTLEQVRMAFYDWIGKKPVDVEVFERTRHPNRNPLTQTTYICREPPFKLDTEWDEFKEHLTGRAT